MPTVRVTITLPYSLVLAEGNYPTPAVGGALKLAQLPLSGSEGGASEPRTSASSVFEVRIDVRPEEIQREREREAVRLIRRVNHLIRWYRAAGGQAEILDLSLAQVGRFTFVDEATGADWGGQALEFTLPPTVVKTQLQTEPTVRAGLAQAGEPDVGAFNVLDAEHAMNSGRFREAVLLAWSAIDATFSQAYERVVAPTLQDEYAEGRNFVLGHEVPMKVRMTAVLYLATRRSLFRELAPHGWAQLVTSYNDRNDVIHRGAVATEDQAEKAIALARRVIAIAHTL